MTGKPCSRGHIDKRNLWAKCLSCDAERKREKRSAEPELVRAAQRDRYAKDPEKHRQQAKDSYHRNIDKKHTYERSPQRAKSRRARVAAWREKNPDYAPRYREENREKERERGRIYSRSNPEIVARLASERRARTLQRTIKLPADIEELNRLVIAEAYVLRKQRSLQTGISWHVDHIVPMKSADASGLHVFWNIDVVPARYNQRKHNKITNRFGWLNDHIL